MNFANVQKITIPQGNVLRLLSNGQVLWQVPAQSTETITGTLPLSFEAQAGKIISLIRYGKVTQNGTPTPASPVDIVCNNGVVRMVDDELPNGYKRLVGITFDGNLRYETGEALTGGDDVTMTLGNLSPSGKNVFGSYNGSNGKNFSLYIYGSTSGSYFRYGDQLKRPKYGGTGRRTITFGKSGTSGFADDSEVTPDEFTTPANTYIGMLPNSSSAAFTGDIIGSILVSNRLEWIPCERESDGVIGYYEKHNGNFIEPVGVGTPVSLGYDASHLIVLTVVGTPEVLSVAGQTASVANLYAVGDYRDEQDLISGVVTRRVGVKVLDGTENWSYYQTSGGVSQFRITRRIMEQRLSKKSPVVCSHYDTQLVDADGVAYLQSAFGEAYLYICDNRYTSGVDFKAHIAEQYAAGTPVIVMYQLAEEVAESVTPQRLMTVKGTNTVSTVANVSPVDGSCEYAFESSGSIVGTATVGTAVVE